MTALRKPKLAPAIDVFSARCEARAYLYAIGEIDLHDAVDGLQEHAERYGLIAEIGQDAVQAIMAEIFRHACDLIMEPPPRGVAQSTLDAADYLLTVNDPERLREWLAAHSRADIDSILKHWKARRR
jgi:hypothetical protein